MQANVNCEDAAEEKTRVTELKEKVKDGACWCLDANEPTVSFQITRHTSVLLEHFGAGLFFSRGRFGSQIFVFFAAFNEVVMFRETAALIQSCCR